MPDRTSPSIALSFDFCGTSILAFPLYIGRVKLRVRPKLMTQMLGRAKDLGFLAFLEEDFFDLVAVCGEPVLIMER